MPGHVYQPDAIPDAAELQAVENVCRDVWRAWYSGDAELTERCFHPDADGQGLVRRVIDTRTEFIAMNPVRTSQVIETTRLGLGVADPAEHVIEVTVLDVTHYAASAKTISRGQRTHYFHLLRFPEGWRIVQTIWANPGGVIPNQTTDL